jgi:RNA polymerase sigma factor (sigma-70 family)
MAVSKERKIPWALIIRVYEHVRLLVRRRIPSFPRLNNLDLGDDVMHDAVLRMIPILTIVRYRTDNDLQRLSSVAVTRAMVDRARQESHAGRWKEQARARLGKGVASLELEPSHLSEWTEFHRCVSHLPQKLRQVWGMFFYLEMTHEETASILDVSSRTVKRRLRSARKRLGRCIREWLNK